VLSTPPEQAEITLLFPTIFRMSFMEFSTNFLASNTPFSSKLQFLKSEISQLAFLALP
jgi:hypothetical protein